MTSRGAPLQFFWLIRQSIRGHTSVLGGGEMIAPIRVLIVGGNFARFSVACDIETSALNLLYDVTYVF